MSEVTAKVARVVPPHELVLNVGTNGGVKPRSKARLVTVYEVTDPDSNQRLGSYVKTEVNGRITHVSDTFSVFRVTDTEAQPAVVAGLGTRDLMKVAASPLTGDENALYVQRGSVVLIESAP